MKNKEGKNGLCTWSSCTQTLRVVKKALRKARGTVKIKNTHTQKEKQGKPYENVFPLRKGIRKPLNIMELLRVELTKDIKSCNTN